MSVKILFSLLSFIFFTHTSFASQPLSQKNQLEVVLLVPDTLVSTGEQTGLLNIYLDNFNYEIFGFQFVLRSSRPDLIS